MEQRLIDANAYAAEMKTRQDACKEIMDAAKEDDNCELYAHMSAAFSIFVEAKLTLDAMPTVDAVPVKWIETYMDSLGANGLLFNAMIIEKLLRDYKKRADGERKDGERKDDGK